jgi:hypothetical protein
MAAVVGPGGTAKRRPHAAREPKLPYTEEEVEALFNVAEHSRSAKRRHDLCALMVLGLGAGATGQEAAHARPADVVGADGDVAVALRRLRRDGTWRERIATLLPDYRARLLDLVTSTGGAYLLGGGVSRHSRVYDLCDQSRAGRWPVLLDAGRLRATYLAKSATQPHPVLTLLELGGVSTLEVFDSLLPALRAREASPL